MGFVDIDNVDELVVPYLRLQWVARRTRSATVLIKYRRASANAGVVIALITLQHVVVLRHDGDHHGGVPWLLWMVAA
jgi:hypothetical protein